MSELKAAWAKWKALDYRHYICIVITLGFLGCGFVYCNALPRLGESIRDFFVSLAYYFVGIFDDFNNPITPTVIQMPSWQFAPSRFEPLKLFPWTWEEFKVLWGEYWRTWATWDNVVEYFYTLGDLMRYVSKFLLILSTLVLPLGLWGYRYLSVKNNDKDKKSKPLTLWERFTYGVVLPVRMWLKRFWSFLSETDYKPFWIFLWLLYFNVISLVVDFFAYYFYFITSLNVVSLYTQLLKLMVDLAPMVRTIPGVIWALIGYWLLNVICRSQAMSVLQHNERCNRGFLNERGVVTIVYGPMGVGKTSLLTSMALSEEVALRDQALEIILESDIMFPHFPWDKLRREIQKRMETRQLVDVPSVKRWLASWRPTYEWLQENGAYKWWKRQVQKRGLTDVSFGYDFSLYPSHYNDELKIRKLYSVIEDYACSYFVYTIETSLIISNYAIRTDAIKEDLGNFPTWNHDFFDRDPRLMAAFSRHSHIIDFDILRLGKRMVEENPNRNAFGFGVYVVSEIDKERKNALALKETKINAEECNQRNDLFDSCLKMSRHACVIANKVFLKIICDLQRPEDWGAGGREVGEVVYIARNGDLMPAFPFFSPFWLTEGIFRIFKGLYNKFSLAYDKNRADKTLLMHWMETITSKLDNHYRKLNNLYGSQVLELEVESGRMNGDVAKKKWYRMPKKDFSGRYSTNCLSAIFEGDELNTVSIADFKEYADIMASQEELLMQNSHFQTDVAKMKRTA